MIESSRNRSPEDPPGGPLRFQVRVCDRKRLLLPGPPLAGFRLTFLSLQPLLIQIQPSLLRHHSMILAVAEGVETEVEVVAIAVKAVTMTGSNVTPMGTTMLQGRIQHSRGNIRFRSLVFLLLTMLVVLRLFPMQVYWVLVIWLVKSVVKITLLPLVQIGLITPMSMMIYPSPLLPLPWVRPQTPPGILTQAPLLT